MAKIKGWRKIKVNNNKRGWGYVKSAYEETNGNEILLMMELKHYPVKGGITSANKHIEFVIQRRFKTDARKENLFHVDATSNEIEKIRKATKNYFYSYMRSKNVFFFDFRKQAQDKYMRSGGL